MASRTLTILLAVVLAALVLATLATGSAIWMIPAIVLILVIGVGAGINRVLKRQVDSRYDGDMDAAMSDNDNPIPSTHLIADDETPLGDTAEAHDEISPHDLPKGHPGRPEAEHQAEEHQAHERADADGAVTRGNR
jgi:hypothetical protein